MSPFKDLELTKKGKPLLIPISDFECVRAK